MNRFDEEDDYPADSIMGCIADELGQDFHDKVIATLGGTEVKVPKRLARLGEDHALVAALGAEDAAKLVAVIGGEVLHVPCSANAAAARRSAVVAAVRQGQTTNQIARTLGISARHVRRLRQRADEPMMAAE